MPHTVNPRCFLPAPRLVCSASQYVSVAVAAKDVYGNALNCSAGDSTVGWTVIVAPGPGEDAGMACVGTTFRMTFRAMAAGSHVIRIYVCTGGNDVGRARYALVASIQYARGSRAFCLQYDGAATLTSPTWTVLARSLLFLNLADTG